MKRRSLLLCFLLIHSFVHAQNVDFDHYKRLKCEGPLPKDFTTQSLVKYEEAKKQIDTKEKYNKRKAQDQFYLESSYSLNKLLLSGRVLFGDAVTNYLNNIKDILLKDEPELRNQIRIYTLKSSSVNAFCMNDGVVLVTTGLLAQVENEAQIAFVLCHEFTHFIKKHAIDEYVENVSIVQRKGIYRNLSKNDVDLYRFSFSKEKEMEADLFGLEIYKKSKYSLSVVEGAFNVLLYSYLPFDEIEFNKSFFENSSYAFPPNFVKEKLSVIAAEEDFNDEKSTHPNIKKRKSSTLRMLEGESNEGRELFHLPKEKFIEIQKICRYELCLLQLTNAEYEDAIYSAYILQLTDTNNVFLKKIIARGLYGLTMYQNASETRKNVRSYSDIEGNSQQLYYFLYKLSDKEMNILALKNAWAVHKLDSGDMDIDRICTDLIRGLVFKHNFTRIDFQSKYYVPNAAADTILESTSSSKYDKIKQKKTIVESETKYHLYAFVPYMKDTSFISIFSNAEEEFSQQESEKLKKGKKKIKTEKEIIAKHGYALDVDNLVVVNPVYYKYDETSKTHVKYTASELALDNLHTEIIDNSKKLGINIDFIEGGNIQESETDKFNDMSLLNEWIGEQVDHSEFKMVNTYNNEFTSLSSKFNTSNFAWIGIISVKKKKEFAYENICAAMIYFPLAPYIIYTAAAPQYQVYFFTMVVDGKTGDTKMDYVNRVSMKDIKAVQSQNIYYILQQIKSKRT